MFIYKLDKNDWGYAISVFVVPVRNEYKITVALDHPVVLIMILIKILMQLLQLYPYITIHRPLSY